MRRYLSWFLILSAGAVDAETMTYAFEWHGGEGYTLKGAMEYQSEAVTGRFVTAQDLTCFVIEGRMEDTPLGRWALTMRNEETTWRLHFDPLTDSFLVDGQGIWMPQAWNMNGEGNNCGPDGFGFNIGNAAQDICLDNTLILESQAQPDRPFPAVRVSRYEFPRDACNAPALLGHLQGEAGFLMLR